MPIEPHVVRVPFGRSVPIKSEPPDKPFAAWDEAQLAAAMLAQARAEGHMGALPVSTAKQKAGGAKGAGMRRDYSTLMVRLLSHLRYGNVQRGALRIILGGSGNFNTQLRRAFQMGWITGGNGSTDLISITVTGIIALGEMREQAAQMRAQA